MNLIPILPIPVRRRRNPHPLPMKTAHPNPTIITEVTGVMEVTTDITMDTTTADTEVTAVTAATAVMEVTEVITSTIITGAFRVSRPINASTTPPLFTCRALKS